MRKYIAITGEIVFRIPFVQILEYVRLFLA
jgi:hypothetical protein